MRSARREPRLVSSEGGEDVLGGQRRQAACAFDKAQLLVQRLKLRVAPPGAEAAGGAGRAAVHRELGARGNGVVHGFAFRASVSHGALEHARRAAQSQVGAACGRDALAARARVATSAAPHRRSAPPSVRREQRERRGRAPRAALPPWRFPLAWPRRRCAWRRWRCFPARVGPSSTRGCTGRTASATPWRRRGLALFWRLNAPRTRRWHAPRALLTRPTDAGVVLRNLRAVGLPAAAHFVRHDRGAFARYASRGVARRSGGAAGLHHGGHAFLPLLRRAVRRRRVPASCKARTRLLGEC